MSLLNLSSHNIKAFAKIRFSYSPLDKGMKKMTKFYTKLVRLYSSSFYNIVKNSKCLEKHIEEIQSFKNFIDKDKLFIKTVSAPIYSIQEKTSILNKIRDSFSLSKEFLNFLRLLIANNRFINLPEILSHIQYTHNLFLNKIPVEITIAEDLSSNEKKMIVEKVENFLNSKIIPEFKMDSHILGGFVIKKDNIMYDASLARSLSSFKENVKFKILKLESN